MRLMFGHFIKNVIENYSQKVNLEYGKTLATVIHSIIVVVVIVFAIDQLQIETKLLNRIIEITLISAGVTLALSLGIGTKDLSRNVISGIYLKEQLKPGAHIKVKDIEGRIQKVGAINTIIEVEGGSAYYIPNTSLVENTFKSSKPS